MASRRWSSLILPACEECNSRYGEFEELAKPAFERLSEGYLRSRDAQIILDYMDKTRVSVWLWRLYWCKRDHAISRNFHVDDRVGSSDRVLLVGTYPVDDARGIAPIGYDTKCFLRCPSVIGLFVKNFFLLSISGAGFLTDHFSMTSATVPLWQLSEGQVGRRITGRVQYRSLEKFFRLGGLRFFSFGSHTDHIAPLSAHVFLDAGTGARRVRACEEFEVPQVERNAQRSKILAQLNVHEIQRASLNEYDRMNIPGKEKVTTRLCRDELDARIRGDHLMLEATSPLLLSGTRQFFKR